MAHNKGAGQGRYEISDVHDEKIAQLLATLKPCALQLKPVELHVIGLASQSPHRSGAAIDSDTNRKNTILANGRAQAVAEYILDRVPADERGNSVLVSSHEWSSFQAMADNLVLIDKPRDDVDLTGLEKYNQVAIVYLKNRGACGLDF